MTHEPGKRDFWKLFLLIISTMSLTVVLGPMETALEATLGVNAAQISLIGFLFLLIAGFVSFFWAFAADKLEKRKILLLISSFIWSIGALLTIFITGFVSLLIIQCITAVGYAGILPLSISLIIDLIPPEDRTRFLGWLTVGMTLGTGLGILIAGTLIDITSWWVPFLIISLLGFLSIYRVSLLREPKKGAQEKLYSDIVNFKMRKEDLKEIFKMKSNILLILYIFLKFIAVGGISFHFVPMLMKDHQFNMIEGGSTFATLIMIGTFSIQIIGAPYLGKLADNRYKHKNTAKAELIILIVLIGSLFYLGGFLLDFPVFNILMVLLFSALILLGAFFMAGDGPISQSILGDVNPPQVRTTIYSITFIAQMTGQSIGILITGILYGIFGNVFKWSFVTITFVLIASILLLIPLKKTVPSDLAYLETKFGRNKSQSM
ncbi:MAG: MFS transporter [Candidatus Helarchaeota archaeon]